MELDAKAAPASRPARTIEHLGGAMHRGFAAVGRALKQTAEERPGDTIQPPSAHHLDTHS